MGSIFKRGKIYYVDFRVKGRRIRKKVGTSKKLAEDVLKDIEGKIVRGEFGFDKPDTSLETLFNSFTEYSKTNHAPATSRRYWNVIRNFQVLLAYYFSRVKFMLPISKL